MAELTPKQRRFVDEYLVDLNGAAAAQRAGYTQNSSAVRASEMMAMPAIQEAIAAAQRRRSMRTGINADRVLTEIARLGFSDLRKAFSADGSRLLRPDEWSDDMAASVASMEIERRVEGKGEDAEVYHVHKIKLWDKNAALEKICKHLGLYEKDNNQKPLTVVISPRDANL
ncbi:terminase small subunit [Acetobacteraceae bacterium KSS8]|uniref:Terminase small subunit n=1 Tax=Endosaccharibacter trunci TaxID=2812733 RepID=A0ABT1WAG5_9PROT|nr:terminase small subunit [Acetobacteraceae bacterium KSS8]